MRKCVVYGGCGGLGREIVNYLKIKGVWTLSGQILSRESGHYQVRSCQGNMDIIRSDLVKGFDIIRSD